MAYTSPDVGRLRRRSGYVLDKRNIFQGNMNVTVILQVGDIAGWGILAGLGGDMME